MSDPMEVSAPAAVPSPTNAPNGDGSGSQTSLQGDSIAPPPPSLQGPAPSHPPGGGSTSVVAQTLKMNKYFKQNNVPHSEPNRLVYLEYTRNHAGAEPPASLFAAPVPPPSTVPVVGSASDPSTGVPPPPSGPAGPPPVATKKNVDTVQAILRQAYNITHDDRAAKQQRMADVQSVLMNLKNASSGMSVLQANLMYQPDRQAPSQQPQQRPGGGGGGGGGGQLSAMPPGNFAPGDPRYDPQRSNSNLQNMTPAQQQAYMAQRGAKRKEPPGTPGMMSMNQPGNQQAKYRRESMETSAAEARTQRAIEMQNSNLGTPMMSPSMSSSPYNNQPRAPQQRGGPGGGYPSPAPMASGGGGYQSMSRAEQVRGALLSQWQVSKQPLADKDHLYLDATPLVNKFSNIASEHGVVLQSGDGGIASIELLMLATESFLKNIVQSARHLARRRQDVAKGYLPLTVTNEPRRELDEIQKGQEERKLRWQKHRERAADESKRKAAQAGDQKALEQQAKLDAAIAEAEKARREAGGGTGTAASSTGGSGGGEDEYTLGLLATIGGGSVPGANTTATPAAAPSFLPPSTIQHKSFLPSSSLPSGAGGSSSQPTILVQDLLAVMEAHPRLRKGSRLYKSFTLLNKKRPVESMQSLQADVAPVASVTPDMSTWMGPTISPQPYSMPPQPSNFNMASMSASPAPSNMYNSSLPPPALYAGMPRMPGQ